MGALVQANYGRREELRVGGYPVGALLSDVASPFRQRDVGVPGMGLRSWLRSRRTRLCCHINARRLRTVPASDSPVGGGTEYASGDIFVAFSVGNRGLPIADYGRTGTPLSTVQSVNPDFMTPLFTAAADAVEEAILNALLAATDADGHGVHVSALGTGRLLNALEQAGWRPDAARL